MIMALRKSKQRADFRRAPGILSFVHGYILFQNG
jgi:hypothetical protein